MNKKFKYVYIANCIASVLFILSLFCNAFTVETTEHYSSTKYTTTYKAYTVFESINNESVLGLIPASLAIIALALVVVGIIIWVKNKMLSQSFISGGIICSFVQLNSVWLELKNVKDSNDVGEESLADNIINTKNFGYVLCLTALLVVIVSTTIFIYMSMNEGTTKEKTKGKKISETERYNKIIELENLLDAGTISKEEYDSEIKKLIS